MKVYIRIFSIKTIANFSRRFGNSFQASFNSIYQKVIIKKFYFRRFTDVIFDPFDIFKNICQSLR